VSDLEAPPEGEPGRERAQKGSPPVRVLLLLLLMISSISLCVVALLKGWVRPQTLQELVARAGSLGMLAYVVGIVIMELLWFPRMWGLLAGGLLFGPVLGGTLSLAGDLAGAYLCFMLARGGGREWVQGLLERRARADQVVKLLVERRGLSTVAVMRVCPVFHYTLASYAAGLAGVSPRTFMAGTALGILPGAVLYPLAGDAVLRPTSPVFIGSVAVIVVFLIVTMIAARKILKRQPEDQP
jgi:uncharacterized membrane protein YdjX (TVP38/TMEM64 family)